MYGQLPPISRTIQVRYTLSHGKSRDQPVKAYIDGLMVRVFANGPGDLGSIPSRVIPNTQKWYLIPSCLTICIKRYGSRVKWVNPGKGVEPSHTTWYSSYRKACLQVILDYGRQLYFAYVLTLNAVDRNSQDGWTIGRDGEGEPRGSMQCKNENIDEGPDIYEDH